MRFLRKFGLKRKHRASNSRKKSETVQAKNESPTAASFKSVEIPKIERIVACTSNAAFQEAWQRHWECLTEKERAAWSSMEFTSPIKVHQILDDLNKQHEALSVSRRIANRSLRFLQAVETLMAGAVISVNSYPDVSAVVIGVIRVILNAAIKYFEYYEKLSEMLERLADRLEILNLYVRNSKHEPLLHSTLIAIYGDILAFCRQAQHAFIDFENMKKPSSLLLFAKVQWTPFEVQFGEILSDLEHHEKSLAMISTAVTMNTTLDINKNMEREKAADAGVRRTQFLEWVSQADAEALHDIMRRKRFNNTGSWLLKQKTFLNWMSDSSSALLWLYGSAGMGKSVLASLVIDHLSENQEAMESVVAYTYIRGNDADMQNLPAQVLSIFIKQLCSCMDALPEEISKLYDKFKRNARKPHLSDLEKMFVECTKHLKKVFVVLDGLDECHERYRQPLLQFLCTTGHPFPNVKVFISSRREEDIANSFSGKALEISLTKHCVMSDLEKVVRNRVSKDLKHLQLDLQQQVIETLIQKSNGMFLWVEYQLQDLTRTRAPDVRRQLEMLPIGLDETYIRIFQKISRLPEASRKLAQRCLLWTMYAKEPLEEPELLDAVSIDQKIRKDGSPNYSSSDVRAVTFDLLVMNWIYDSVSVKHFTVHNFFTNPPSGMPSECAELIPTTEGAHAQMAIMCLQHLLADAPSRNIFEDIISYCGRQFAAHIRHLKEIPEELLNLLDELFWKKPEKFSKILAWKWPEGTFEDYPNFSCPGGVKSVDVNLFLRCTELDQVPFIWSRYASSESSPESYPEEYIFLAAIAGMEDIVKALIARGANINRVTKNRLTPLHYACIKNQIGVVRILLDAGADWKLDQVPRGNADQYPPPIVCAADCLEPSTGLKYFVERKDFSIAATLRCIPPNELKPIHIQKFIDSGADINQKDDQGKTALEVARECGHDKIVKFLEAFERGSDVSEFLS